MSKFQIILLVVFGSFIVIAVLVFSLSRSGQGGTAQMEVWGDISSYDFLNFLAESGLSQDTSIQISYVEKPRESLERDFTEALAVGRGPDLVVLSQDMLWTNKSKLFPIPYESVSERDFKSTFIEEGELLLSEEGIYGFPLIVDPMVLYYNRDILTNKGIAKPIAYWDELYNASLALTEKDAAGNIKTSAMAMGEARNISHFKEILSLLTMQAGAPITQFVGGELHAGLQGNFDLPTSPAEAALEFYAQFANPAKAYHTWNRSENEALTNFTAGDAAYYLGFASEMPELRAKNPTLNFAVAPIPQSRVSSRVLTYGNLRSVSISRGTKNPQAALTAAMKLVSKDPNLFLSKTLSLPPTRRDLLSAEAPDASMSVFYEAALQATAWRDPNTDVTREIFKEMIESVTSGRARTNEAVNQANKELDTLLGH